MPLENATAYLNFDQQFLSLADPEITIENLAYGDSVQLLLLYFLGAV